MVRPRLLPRSTRWRVALLAALASALALGFGSWWFVSMLQNGLTTAAGRQADDKLIAVKALLDSGVAPIDVVRRLGYGGYQITPAATEGETCPGTSTYSESDGNPVIVSSSGCVTAVPFGGEGSVFTAALTSDRKHDVIATAPLDPIGLDTVDTTQRLLWGIVPATSLLIGAVAWFAVRRSLRAVEGIRTEVDGVRARDLGRRVPVPDSGDEITELAVTMNDMLGRLDRSVQRQSQFTADASHELRTPLASLRTQLEVQLAHPGRIDWRATCENAVLDVTRMQDLVADLLLLSKLDAEQTTERERVAMADLVTEHVEGRIPGDIALDVKIEAMPVVEGHIGRLDRVLRNLVDNAVQHARSRVTITLTTQDGQCVLIMADDGPGIPPEDRERVFDQFVRLDEDRSRDDGGSGLGLAIAAEIAREHGGSLAVAESQQGARMEFRLPLA